MTMSIARPVRRQFLTSAAAAGLAAGLARAAVAASADQAFANAPFRRFSSDDWRKRLPAASFNVLREDGTERPFSSPLNDEHRKGIFACLGCDLPLFRSEWKFNSGTGWPSFYRIIEAAAGRKLDLQIGVPRMEYHCARCLGHQGHVFEDGPQPTGLRYCNNGVALKFLPA